MSETLKILKKNSKMRRQMMADMLGFSTVKQLCHALNPYRMKKKKKKKKQKSKHPTRHVVNARPRSPEYIYEDFSTVLEGTKSFSPHNDYCQHYIDTGQRPQNFIRDNYLYDRFEEHPKLKELIQLKDELIRETATPPMFLKCDLNTYDLKELNMKFDVILMEPPLEEYQQILGSTAKLWNWNQIMNIKLNEIAANRSFIFLWCGSSDGLDKGRDCLRHWGFRRCEDICWIQTNIKNPKQTKTLEPHTVFQRTKEHCLMGIKGTVRRSTDGNFIHANIDTDLIISEGYAHGSIEKPIEIFKIIEHFCLGKRRLHLFGRDSTIRPGWLTVGHELTNSNFDIDVYNGYFSNGQLTTGCTNRIEELRPKSPPFKNKVPKHMSNDKYYTIRNTRNIL